MSEISAFDIFANFVDTFLGAIVACTLLVAAANFLPVQLTHTFVVLIIVDNLNFAFINLTLLTGSANLEHFSQNFFFAKAFFHSEKCHLVNVK